MTALRILHVDDEPDIREVVAMSLDMDEGVITRSCASGEEAIKAAADWSPDVILLDVMMPVMDGPATLVQLKKNQKTAGIPVLFMTARAQTRELDFFRSLGAAGVICKPFDAMTLAASVRSHVPSLGDRFGAMRSVFARRADTDAASLTALEFRLTDDDNSDVAVAEISRIAHGLSGAGGIFGFSEISSAAAELEEAIAIRSQNVAAETLSNVRQLIAALCSAIRLATAQSHAPAAKALNG